MKMITIPLTSEPELSEINNIRDIQTETRNIKARIKQQEAELRVHFKLLPREALKMGIGNAVPAFMKSKAAGFALTAGSALVGNFLLPKAATKTASVLGSTLKKAGLAALGNMALKWIFKRKGKSGK